MAQMKRTTTLMIAALGVGMLLVLGGCRYDSAVYDYHYDGGHGDYATGYVINETRHRPRARQHYTTGYNVGYHNGYYGGGRYISIGHTRHYGLGYHHRSHRGYHHGGHHRGHRSHYGHRGHGSIHFGGGYGGYYCD